ncbi:hypothetical protein BROUX41_002903 [Berkeleyomyces rouxiae]|uniref:uncharacterized protein n=1 Tax=Berkeleyomyces rouxiae TaxID=2035830 RepID=UPI003B7F7E4C
MAPKKKSGKKVQPQGLVKCVQHAIKQVQAISDRITDMKCATLEEYNDLPEVKNGPSTPVATTALVDTLKVVQARCVQAHFFSKTHPITPSAIMTVVKEIETSCSTYLIPGVLAWDPKVYTVAFISRIADNIWPMLAVVSRILTVIPTSPDKPMATDLEKNMALCVSLLAHHISEFEHDLTLGPRHMFAEKHTTEAKATIDDMIEELAEWKETSVEGDDSEESYDCGFDSDDSDEDLQDLVDALTNQGPKMPKDDREGMCKVIDLCISNSKLISTLYDGIATFRLATLPDFPLKPEVARRVDDVIELLDDMNLNIIGQANTFFEMDREELEEDVEAVAEDAEDLFDALMLNWDGEEDEYTKTLKTLRSSLKRQVE